MAKSSNNRLVSLEKHLKGSISTYNMSAPSEAYIPWNNDGFSNENEATATCFCSAVQLVFVSDPSDGRL